MLIRAGIVVLAVVLIWVFREQISDLVSSLTGGSAEPPVEAAP